MSADARAGRTVVVTQSNYIPWRGYFDMIRQADELILLDTVQYTRRDWRNRNIIRTRTGPKWLTIPVDVKGRFHQPIDQTVVADPDWAEDHIRQIEINYRQAAGYGEVAPWLFAALREASGIAKLADVNRHLIETICARLGIERPIRQCAGMIDREALDRMEPTERLLSLSIAAGATRYLSGPRATAYLDVAQFEKAGIEVAWMDYGGYPDYPQCWPGFDGKISIIDTLLNCGGDTRRALDRSPDPANAYFRTTMVNS